MKKLVLSIAVLGLFSATSCKDDKNPKTPDEQTVSTTLDKDITTNTTLKAGKTYSLENIIYVREGATLTIEAGVTIKAKKGKNAIVVSRGAKIKAEGTATDPIVFTSAETSPNNGDWGGLVILGKATTNAVFNGTAGVGEIEGGVNTAEGYGLYGGTDDNDNSGILKYVRIEYAGYPFQPNSELNSLTLGAVGRGTTISHVQTAHGFDDAFEMFGGTVNIDHIISYKTLDDDFDTDNGYRGTIQFAIAIRDKNLADVSGSNGFESDNDASGTANLPQTAPTFANVTIIGPKADANTTIDANFKRGAHLRRNTATSIYNSILMGYPTGIYLDGSLSATNLGNGTMNLKGLILAGMNTPIDSNAISGANINFAGIFNAAAANNNIFNTIAEIGLSSPYATGSSFNPTPNTTSPAATGAVTISGNSAIQVVSYRGAVAPGGNDTWWKGWTKF